jgi:threonine/homoserine/homoserine lactone efflux protein
MVPGKLVMNLAQLGAFVVASAIVIIVPGVDMALFTRQVLMHGRRAALVTLAGGFTGGLTHTALATAGLSVVLATSATAYTLVKIVGAAYLVVVGLQTLWATRHGTGDHAQPVSGGAQTSRAPMALGRAYLLGLGSNLTNPKMAVFFLTFLPQFVTPGPNATAQTAALGMLFCAMAGVWFVVYILALGRLAPWLGRPRVRLALERATGAILVGLGLRLAGQR